MLLKEQGEKLAIIHFQTKKLIQFCAKRFYVYVEVRKKSSCRKFR